MMEINEFVTTISQFNKCYSTRINKVAEEYSITKIEADIILFLYNNPGYDTARDIVELRHIAKSYVSKAVDMLVKRGYLSSREDDKDRRISRLKLQAPAIIIAKAAKKEQEKIFKEALNGVEKQDRERLKETVNKIAWNIKNCL